MSLFLNLQPLTLQKFLENGATVPVEYTQLVEGHQLYVPVTWLSDIQGAFKDKTKSCAFKLMINGFFEPHEMVGKTGCKVADTPLGKALKGFFFFCFFYDEYQSRYQFLLILANLSEGHFFYINLLLRQINFFFFISPVTLVTHCYWSYSCIIVYIFNFFKYCQVNFHQIWNKAC